MVNTIFVPIICSKKKRTFYARYDYAFDHKWNLTRGVIDLPYASAGSEKIDVQEQASLELNAARIGPQYRCPFCQNQLFAKCGRCGNLFCVAQGEEMFTCPSCGSSGKINGVLSTLSGNSRNSQC